jgi:4-amino-4-deoxy-L-arabinose transferase-like glycosyltransferase
MTFWLKSSLLFATILVLAFVLRVWGIDRDSPSVDILPDDAAWTDEGTLALPAIDAVRGYDSLSNSAALPAGLHPVYNVILYETFKLFGAGRIQGRAISVLFGVLGLVALARLGKILWPDMGALLALALGGFGFFPVIFDRLILVEGPLVALLSVLTLLGVQTQSALGALSVGIGLGLVAVGVKLHALSLLIPLALLYALRRRRLLLPFLIGVGIVLLVWRALWIPQFPGYVGYIGSRMTEQNMGLAEPLQVLLQVFLAGLPGYFFPYQISLLFLACIEILAFLLAPRRWIQSSPDLLLVALIWLPIALAGPSLFRYVPTRYFIPAFPALALLAIAGIRRLWDGNPLPQAARRFRFAIGLGMGAFFLFQTTRPLPLFRDLSLWIPILGLSSPLLFYWLTTRTRPGLGWSQSSRFRIIALLLFFHFFLQGGLYWAGVVQSRSDLPQAAADLSATLPSNAILAGPMAGTMALLSTQRASPIFSRIDSEFLDNLSPSGPVWILILEGDENLVTPQVQADLVQGKIFPVGYSYKVQYMKVWQVERK